MVVPGGDVRHERTEGVERSLVTQLFFEPHVDFDLMHRDVPRPFDHHLHVLVPGTLGQFA